MDAMISDHYFRNTDGQKRHIKLLMYYGRQAISARERALCQLTVCFEFQRRSERSNRHKSCVQQMDSEIRKEYQVVFLYCIVYLYSAQYLHILQDC